jgi:hypothetical protein
VVVVVLETLGLDVFLTIQHFFLAVAVVVVVVP